ncbi:MAG: hypothetical protein Kow00109_07110 [Acidobacteriota bacterium]
MRKVLDTTLSALWNLRKPLLAAYLVGLLLALPPFLVLRDEWQRFLERSEAAEELARGFNERWFAEFEEVASPWLTEAAEPRTAEFGALLRPLDRFLGGRLWEVSPGLVALGVLYLLSWIFMGGAFVASSRLGRTVSLADWIGLGGRYFGRCFRLAVLLILLLGACFWFSEFLRRVIEDAARDVIDERVVFAWTAARLGVVAVFLWLFRQWFNFARAVVVAEERTSVGLALLRSLYLLAKYPFSFLAVCAILGVVGAAVFAGGVLFAPGVGQTGLGPVVLAFACSQIFVVARIVHRVAGQVAFWSLHRELAEREWPPAPATSGWGASLGEDAGEDAGNGEPTRADS